MIAAGDKIIAGVSGGADSLCLLYLLLEYAKRVPLSLGVVHVNHGIRREAKEDAEYVEELCRREGLPFFLTEARVQELAEREKCSPEDAGRRVRYAAFYRAAETMGAGKIAVAHNSNDNAETMLFHLFRGSGMKGICGIASVRGKIIRPVLCLERSEVEAYLKQRGVVWRLDSTNEEDDYSRNRIRHHILPYAEREIFSGAVERMARTAELLQETEDYLQTQTLEALKRCLRGAGERWGLLLSALEADAESRREYGPRCNEGLSIRLDVEKFLEFHPALRKRMLLMLLKGFSPTGKDILQVHVRDALSLFAREGNRSVCLPFGILARRQYGEVVLERGAAGETVGKTEQCGREYILKPENLLAPVVYDLEKAGKIEFSVFFLQNCHEVPKNQYTKWFDYDRIEGPLAIRSRRAGDYLTIAKGEGGIAHKSLKNYMVTEKIPRGQRDEMFLVAEGSHVLWLIGQRISEYYKVSGNTKRILQVRVLGEERGAGCGNHETEEKNVGTH